MVNVACLNRQPFADILSGEKRNEFRLRQRIDPRLEAVRSGEEVVFLERGSDRALWCNVVDVVRFGPEDDPEWRPGDPPYCYDIKIRNVRLADAPGVRHLQGWNRVERLPH